MRSKPIVIITILLSAIGAGLQRWYQTTAFELGTNLPLSHTTALTVLRGFIIAVPVLAVLLSLPLWGERPKGETSLYDGLDRPRSLVGALAGALMLAGGALQLAGDLLEFFRWREILQLGTCAVDALLTAGGWAMIWMALSARKEHWVVHHSLGALLPGFAGCFWLVIYYHSHSRDAVVTHYCWVLLCLMASILAFYYQAGFAFDRQRPLRGLACTMTAAVYAFTTLPASASLAQLLLLLGIGVWMALHCSLILRRSEVHGHRERQNV